MAPPPSPPSTIDELLGQKKVYQCQVSLNVSHCLSVSHRLTNNEATSYSFLGSKHPSLIQTHSSIERNDLKYNQINSYDGYDKNEEVLDELKIVIIKIYQTNQYDSFI